MKHLWLRTVVVAATLSLILTSCTGESATTSNGPSQRESATLSWDGSNLQTNVTIAQHGASAEAWTASELTITPNSLGTVTLGMTNAQVNAAAGVQVDASGEGYYDSVGLPSGSLHLYVGGDPVRCVGASIKRGSSAIQRVATPDSVAVGETVSKLENVYGSRAVFTPASGTGRTNNTGYVVSSADGDLTFVIDAQQKITGIAGGKDLTPNSCVG